MKKYIEKYDSSFINESEEFGDRAIYRESEFYDDDFISSFSDASREPGEIADMDLRLMTPLADYVEAQWDHELYGADVRAFAESLATELLALPGAREFNPRSLRSWITSQVKSNKGYRLHNGSCLRTPGNRLLYFQARWMLFLFGLGSSRAIFAPYSAIQVRTMNVAEYC